MKESSANRKSDVHLWLRISLIVGLLATAASPMLFQMLASRCSGFHDPTNGIFLLPALPAIFLIRDLGIESELAYSVGVGASYGALCFLLGLPAIMIRQAHRR